jgi:hypothetical protein
MITKMSANGKSDINMLLVSPPPAAWANAGVINIRTILVKREWTGNAPHHAGLGKFARTIAAAVPIATLADPSFTVGLSGLRPAKRPDMAAWSGTPEDVEKVPKNKTSRRTKISDRRDKASGSVFRT